MFIGLQKQIQAVAQFWKGKPVTLVIVLVGLILAIIKLETQVPPPGLDVPPSSTPEQLEPQPTRLPELRQTDAPPQERGELLTEANIRSRPTVRSPVQTVGLRGDQVTIVDQAPGLDDSYAWYLIRLPGRTVEGWVRGDLLRTVPSPLESPVGSGSRPEGRPESRPSGSRSAIRYPPEALPYFQEIAFGNEFGSSQNRRIRKWTSAVTIRVHGDPTRRDQDTLEQVVTELNRLIGRHAPQVQLILLADDAPQKASLDIYFVPHPQFPSYEPNYQPGNLGFAYVNWSQDRIYRGRILISTIDISQQERSHLIREELTQAMGLLQDSERYDDSIFYQGWTRTTQYTELDKAVIEMLYYPNVKPGMDERSAIAALQAPPSALSDALAEGPANFLLPMGRRLLDQLKPW